MSTSPFDHEALWDKSRLFVNRSFEESRDFEEAALWASMGLELLGKAALAFLNPLLVANPDDDGKSLLIAAGVKLDKHQFSSIQAKAVWARCERAFKPFNGAEAARIAANRNEYVHGVGIGYDAIPADIWWARYWAQSAILVANLDREIHEYVGATRAPVVERHIAAGREYLAARLETLLQRARSRLELHSEGRLGAKQERLWDTFDASELEKTYPAECPACSSEGNLEGEEVQESKVESNSSEYDEPDWGEPTVTLVISSERFWCPTCHLVLADFDLIREAGMDESFEVEGDPADYYDEMEYMNE